MSGFDAKLTLHLQESEWEVARDAVQQAQEILEEHGFTVTPGPALPHMPLSSVKDIAACMDEEES
jgi:hypothetical protein